MHSYDQTFIIPSRYLALQTQRRVVIHRNTLRIYPTQNQGQSYKQFKVADIIFSEQKNYVNLAIKNHDRQYKLTQDLHKIKSICLAILKQKKAVTSRYSKLCHFQEENILSNESSFSLLQQHQHLSMPPFELKKRQIEIKKKNSFSTQTSQQSNEDQLKRFLNNNTVQIALKYKFMDNIRKDQNRLSMIDDEGNNYILKNYWGFYKQGGLQFINQQKLKMQNQCFYFLIKQIGKSLFTSKPFWSISFPVYVFRKQSILQSFAKALATAPLHLDKVAAKGTPAIQRLKKVVIIMLNFSLLFVSPQKPFNPVIGETYQSFIDGCGYYAQQVSHHPPISSFIFYGRGYKIWSSMQLKANVNPQTATGVFSGDVNFVFDNPCKESDKPYRIMASNICGKITGILFGTQHFIIDGAAYAYDSLNNFASYQKKDKDFIQGFIGKVGAKSWSNVSKQNMDRFEKYKMPKQNQILQKAVNISACYTKYIKFNGIIEHDYFDKRFLPFVNQQQRCPLPSNSNWRPDILCLRMGDMQQSQHFKQQVQNMQRSDRITRQKGKH